MPKDPHLLQEQLINQNKWSQLFSNNANQGGSSIIIRLSISSKSQHISTLVLRKTKMRHHCILGTRKKSHQKAQKHPHHTNPLQKDSVHNSPISLERQQTYRFLQLLSSGRFLRLLSSRKKKPSHRSKRDRTKEKISLTCSSSQNLEHKSGDMKDKFQEEHNLEHRIRIFYAHIITYYCHLQFSIDLIINGNQRLNLIKNEIGQTEHKRLNSHQMLTQIL